MIAPSMPSKWEGAEDDEGSVEARCARIRGRMMWILSQLEGEDADALLEQPAGNGQSARELDDQRQRLEAKHAAEMEQLERRLRAAHQTEVSGLRSELIAAKEQTRTVQVEAAAAQAARAVEQKMARQEAAGLGEAAALKRQVALYEQAMRQVGPVLAMALETLAMLGRAAPARGELRRRSSSTRPHQRAAPLLRLPEATAGVPPRRACLGPAQAQARAGPSRRCRRRHRPARRAQAAPLAERRPRRRPAAAAHAVAPAKPASKAVAVPRRRSPLAPARPADRPSTPSHPPWCPHPAAPAAATAAAAAAAVGSGAAAGVAPAAPPAVATGPRDAAGRAAGSSSQPPKHAGEAPLPHGGQLRAHPPRRLAERRAQPGHLLRAAHGW